MKNSCLFFVYFLLKNLTIFFYGATKESSCYYIVLLLILIFMKRLIYLFAVSVMVITLAACGGDSKSNGGYSKTELFGSMDDSDIQDYLEIGSVVFEDSERGNLLVLGADENAPVLSGKVYANTDRKIAAPDLVLIWHTGGKYYLLYCDGQDFVSSSEMSKKWAEENLGPSEQ